MKPLHRYCLAEAQPEMTLELACRRECVRIAQGPTRDRGSAGGIDGQRIERRGRSTQNAFGVLSNMGSFRPIFRH